MNLWITPYWTYFLINVISTHDKSDVSAILQSFSLSVKQEWPVPEIFNSEDEEYSVLINFDQENSYVILDCLYKFGLDSSEYKLEKDPNQDSCFLFFLSWSSW